MAKRAKTDVKLDVVIEQKALLAKLSRMSKATGKSRAAVIREAMNLFTQSVVKVTPPLTKARDCQSWNKRRIIPITEEDSRTFQAFVENPKNRVKNPHAFWEYIQHAWPKDHPWRMKYKVNFRHASRRFTRLFATQREARNHQEITYRNIGKHSWITAMQTAGVPTNAKRPRGTAAMMGKASQVSSGHGPKESAALILSAYLQSRVKGIGSYAIYAVAQSLRKTNTRLKHALNAAEKKVANA